MTTPVRKKTMVPYKSNRKCL